MQLCQLIINYYLQIGMFDIIILVVITTRRSPSWSGPLKNGACGSYFREDKVLKRDLSAKEFNDHFSSS